MCRISVIEDGLLRTVHACFSSAVHCLRLLLRFSLHDTFSAWSQDYLGKSADLRGTHAGALKMLSHRVFGLQRPYKLGFFVLVKAYDLLPSFTS